MLLFPWLLKSFFYSQLFALNIQIEPSSNRLYHKVTPLQKGEKRIVLTMEYLTDHRMTRFGSFISKLKDAIGYFGFYHIFIETKKITDNKHKKEKELPPL